MPRPRSLSILRGRAAALLCAFTALLGCDVDAQDGVTRTGPDEHTDEDDDASSSGEHAPQPAEEHGAATQPRHASSLASAAALGRACAAYCADYRDACPRIDGYDDVDDCHDACAAWELGTPERRGDTVACHHALVPVDTGEGFGSCIAAGPESPICSDDGRRGAVDAAAAI